MGDGSHISFWNDKWLADGALITVVGDKSIRSMAVRQDITTRDFYSSETWANFIQGSEDWTVRKLQLYLQRLLNLIPAQVEFKTGELDTLAWHPNRSGRFTTKSA